MLREFLDRDRQPLPNRFSKSMGELIRKAREEAGINQAELAKNTYRRQAAISDIENGKMEVNATTLMLLSAVLQKPLTYFFPEGWISEIPPEKLSPAEQELLIQAKRLDDDDLQRLIAQARALADLAEREPMESFHEELLNDNE